MKLKLVVDSLEGMDESIKALYEKGDDGKFHLTVDGLEDNTGLKKKAEELLNEKKKLTADYKALEEKLKSFEGLDPEDAKKAAETARKLREKELIDKGDIDELVNQRTAAMKKDHESQFNQVSENLAKVKAENEKLRESLNGIIIDKGIMEAVTAAGVPRKEALQDIIGRARNAWRVDEDGQPKAYGKDGTVRYGKDAKKEMTMAEWAEELVQTAGHLFEENRGGGAKGNITLAGGGKLSAEALATMKPSDKLTLSRQLESGK